MDPVVELGSKLRRPPESLAALSHLGEDDLRLLCDAIDATCERRQGQIDEALRRAVRARWAIRLLRSPGTLRRRT